MADVKKIKLPDNSVYNITDYRIPGVDTVPTSGSGNVITSGGIYAANYAGSDSNGGPALKTYGIPYGAVDSTSTATVITATVDNFPTELTDGVCAYIRNDIISSASGWTLNVNGTGAKPVYASNADATRVTTLFSAASTYLFVYNSTRVADGCWDIYYGYNANDNTVGYNLRTNAATAPAKSKFYRYRILFTSPDGQYLIPSNTSSSTDATATRSVNQDKIDPFGPIWYYSTTTAVSANASAGASYLWLQYTGISLGYSFNRTGAALTLTAKYPVYVKCAPQADGSAIIDANTPFVQSLPSTEDGKIYIFLGYADSATAITLYYWHPVYYYKDNAIRLWTNAADTTITVDTELDLESENPISNGAVTQVIFDNEQVTAAALNDLRDDISTIDKVTASSLNDLNDRMLEAEGTLSEMDEYISDLGEVTSAALNDLNGRLTEANETLENAITSVTYNELVDLRYNKQLKPGHQYRITDYQTTTVVPDTRSAGHQFDIIVTALDVDRLSEDAKATAHEGLPYMGYDNYEDESGNYLTPKKPCFEAWELKYAIDTSYLNFDWTREGKLIHGQVLEWGENLITYLFEYSSYIDQQDYSAHPYEWVVANEEWPQYLTLYTDSESPSVGDKMYAVEYDSEHDENTFVEVGEVTRTLNEEYKGTIYYMKDEFNNVAYFDFKNIQFLKRFNIEQADYYVDLVPSSSGTESYWLYAFSLSYKDNSANSFWIYDATMMYLPGAYYPESTTCNNYIGRYRTVLRNPQAGEIYETDVLSTVCILNQRYDAAYSPGISGVFIDDNAYVQEEQSVITDSWEVFESSRFMKKFTPITNEQVDEKLTNFARFPDTAAPSELVFTWIPQYGETANVILESSNTTDAWTVEAKNYTSNSTWTSFTPNTLGSNGRYYVVLGTLSSSNRKIYVKGSASNHNTSSCYTKFHVTNPCYISGDIMSLIGGHQENGDMTDAAYTNNGSYLFRYLFQDEVNLFSHPAQMLLLQTSRIGTSAFSGMFSGCKNLAVSPVLKTGQFSSSSYSGMFAGCDNMKIAFINVNMRSGNTYYQTIADALKYGLKLDYIVNDSDDMGLLNSAGIIWVSGAKEYYPLASCIAQTENRRLLGELKRLKEYTSTTMDRNKIYNFGTLSSATTFTFENIKEDDPEARHYYWTFDTGSTAPTITWPTGLIWPGGLPPAILPNKHYEISVLDNIVAWMEV